MDTAIHVAAKSHYESGRYDVVIPLNRNVLRIDTFPLAAQFSEIKKAYLSVLEQRQKELEKDAGKRTLN